MHTQYMHTQYPQGKPSPCPLFGAGLGLADGTQAGLVDRMQTRARLYELLDYADYVAFDRDVYAFGER